MQDQGLGWREAMLALAIFVVAAAIRVGYLHLCVYDLQPPRFQVQDAETAITFDSGDNQTDRSHLVANIAKLNWFGSPAPFSDGEESSAYIAPGYPALIGYGERLIESVETRTNVVRWTQCALGALTAAFYFLFARLAFGNTQVGVLAGLLAAINPFWIINAGEFQDGTLASFLLSACLLFGALGQRGSPLASLTFGGSLAGMTLVRAAMLPYAFIACIWFLFGCRKLQRGWLCAVLAILGFANGLAPWTVRNWQAFGAVVPVADSMLVDLWMGNNNLARGGPQDSDSLKKSLTAERLQSLQAEPNQVKRYRMLAEDLRHSITSDPGGTIERRLRSGLSFIFGADWLQGSKMWRDTTQSEVPTWLVSALPIAMWLMMLIMLVFGLLGWHWSADWSREANLASLALFLIPLPYFFTHADHFSGPRLPLDGILICYAAFALAWILPLGIRMRQKTDEA